MNKTELKIPEERVGVLIGKDGEVKKILEKKTNCKITVNSKTGVIKIESEDAIGFLRAQEFIKAIGYGFSPEIAFKLVDDELTVLDVISLAEYSNLQRIKGRIIGKKGKMRKMIEDLLNVNVIVGNKEVAILGNAESVSVAREAIFMLLEGAQHSTVQRFLERKRRDLKLRSLDWEFIG